MYWISKDLPLNLFITIRSSIIVHAFDLTNEAVRGIICMNHAHLVDAKLVSFTSLIRTDRDLYEGYLLEYSARFMIRAYYSQRRYLPSDKKRKYGGRSRSAISSAGGSPYFTTGSRRRCSKFSGSVRRFKKKVQGKVLRPPQ